MTAAAWIHAVPAPRPGELLPGGELFAGRVLLDERSAVLASRIGPAFLAEAGWDPGTWVLALPAEHPLLGLHAVICELLPGGISKEITAAKAAAVLEQAVPSGAVETARCELAAEFLEDLRRSGVQMRETKKKLAVVVKAAGTTLTEIFGVGPVVAATVIGDVADVSRFPGRDNFAAYNGTAPIEVSSGNRKIYRLSRRGNRRINHAVHMAAVTQIRHRHSDGRAYYDRKLAEGKTRKEALRCLKRRISDAIFARLQADARRAAAAANARGPGGQPGNDSDASAAGSHPEHQLFGQATPEPATTLRPPAGRTRSRPAPAPKKTRKGS